jgi:hypothetical protein
MLWKDDPQFIEDKAQAVDELYERINYVRRQSDPQKRRDGWGHAVNGIAHLRGIGWIDRLESDDLTAALNRAEAEAPRGDNRDCA